MERLFAIIGRINSVLFLLVLLGAGALMAWMAFESGQWHRRGAVEVPTADSGLKKPILLSFEKTEDVSGANTQMIRLNTQEKSAKFSSGGYGSETRNILFLTGSEKAARWLFKDHKNLLVVAAQLREESNKAEQRPTRALYFEYISNDTNGDGGLSSADHSNVGLAKPDGTAFSEILHDVARVFSYDLIDLKHLSVVYQKGAVVRHAKFSLETMKLESDQEIINVPSAL